MPIEDKNHRVKDHPKISHSLSPKYHIICCQFVTLHLIQRFYIIDLQWYGLHITSYRQTPNPEIEQPSPPRRSLYKPHPLVQGTENTSTAKAFLVASKSLRVENWRFSITGLEAKRFQINMSVMHTTICRTALRQTANAICTHKFKMIFPIFQENP